MTEVAVMFEFMFSHAFGNTDTKALMCVKLELRRFPKKKSMAQTPGLGWEYRMDMKWKSR